MDFITQQKTKTSGVFLRAANIFFLAAILSACVSPTATPFASPPAAVVMTPAAWTPPPALPDVYQSAYLNPLDVPRTYIKDTCQYLRNKWNPWNAEPGTVVMIVMFHGVYNGEVTSVDGVEYSELKRIMKQLKAQGFEAINTKQFLSFMERNVRIPARSVLIVLDGNYSRKDFEENFREYWNLWKWPVVNGWTSQEDLPENLWLENIRMENEGFVDHQAQGAQIGTYLTDDTSKVVITRELEGSLNAFANRFGKTPFAYIWQGGGFGQRPVEVARHLGYQLGFTSNSRGPVMYNWVPQADQIDNQRPSYIPEANIKDPLMTLPRYWPYQVRSSIDTVRVMGKDAKAYAEAHKAAELEYYDVVCKPIYGPMPSPSK